MALRPPRALWVTAIPPDRSGGGGHIRQAHLIRALAQRFETHLVVAGAVTDRSVRSAVASVTEVEATVPEEPRSTFTRRLRDLDYALVRREPFEVAQHRVVRAALRRAVMKLPAPDLVQLEFASMGPLLPRSHDAHWAITMHNLASTMAGHRAALAAGRRQRALERLSHRNAVRYEAWVRSSFDTVVVVTKEDATALGGAPLMIPNGVDLQRFSRPQLPSDPRVVFTGALYTQPNVDGVLWFADHVWPLVLDRVPRATLDLVGLSPPASVIDLGERPSIAVHADVESTVPFLERSRVSVVPIRVGSGSRLKALEAMAAGRPVVGTTIGLGGLEVRDGIECCIADEPPRFAAAVVDLLLDDDLATTLTSAGRSLVEQRYEWDAIAASYVDAILQRLGR